MHPVGISKTRLCRNFLTKLQNSIDIPPNALAQVAASIEHKHRNILSTDGTGSPYRYAAGQAFKAARRRSYIQLRKDTINSTEMEEVTRMLEGSPRKMAKRLQASPQTLTRQDTTSHPVKKLGRRQSSAAVLGNSSKTHHRVHSYQALIQRPSTSMANTRSTTKSTKSRSSYETIRPAAEPAHQAFGPRQSFHARRSNLEMRVARGLRGSLDTGPRLQRSTSGLGFDDTSAEEWTERS